MKTPGYTFGYSQLIDWESIPDSEAAIIENLPHGSGIDASWDIQVNTAGKIVAYNSYHVMDEYGYYVGWADFSIRWTPGDAVNFRLMFHGANAQYLNWRYLLREYLEDTIAYSIQSA